MTLVHICMLSSLLKLSCRESEFTREFLSPALEKSTSLTWGFSEAVRSTCLNVFPKTIADGERKIFVNACQPGQVAARVILAVIAARLNGFQISNSPISL